MRIGDMPRGDDEWQEWLRLVADDDDGNPFVRSGAPERLLRSFAVSSDPRLREAVARYRGLPLEVAAELTSDENESVVHALAGNTTADPAALDELENHPVAWVREAVASNSATRLESIQRLTWDPDIHVSMTASESLERREAEAMARGESLYRDERVARLVRLGDLTQAAQVVEDHWYFAQFHTNLELVGLAMVEAGNIAGANKVLGRIIGHATFSEGYQDALLTEVVLAWARHREWAPISDAVADFAQAKGRAEILAAVAGMAVEAGAVSEAVAFAAEAIEERQLHQRRLLARLSDLAKEAGSEEQAKRLIRECLAELPAGVPDGQEDKRSGQESDADGSAGSVGSADEDRTSRLGDADRGSASDNIEAPRLTTAIQEAVDAKLRQLEELGRLREMVDLLRVTQKVMPAIPPLEEMLVTAEGSEIAESLRQVYRVLESLPLGQVDCIAEVLKPLAQTVPPRQWISVVVGGDVKPHAWPHVEDSGIEWADFTLIRLPDDDEYFYGGLEGEPGQVGTRVYRTEDGQERLIEGSTRIAHQEHPEIDEFFLGSPTLHPSWSRVWLHTVRVDDPRWDTFLWRSRPSPT